jgi:hypothetical protein
MYSIRRLMLGAMAVGAMFLATQGAKAETLLPVLTGKTQLGPALYRYFYDVNLEGTGTGSNVITGSFITIYDFFGFTGSAGVQAGVGSGVGAWATTTSLLGVNPPLSSPPADSGTDLNVTFTYTGAQQNANVTPIFGFYIDSIYGTTSTVRNTLYGSADKDDTGGDQSNYGRVQGATVPEMSTVVSFVGLLGAGLLGLRRRKQA